MADLLKLRRAGFDAFLVGEHLMFGRPRGAALFHFARATDGLLMTRVKICGITSVADARAACEAGADVLGLNFYSKSPRAVSLARALKNSRRDSRARAGFWGFRECRSGRDYGSVRAARLDAVQLHGDEPSATVVQLVGVVPVFKALRVGPDFSAAEAGKISGRFRLSVRCRRRRAGPILAAPVALPIGASRNRQREGIA